jgi:anti-sigma regulatory factor (Ser/Thr protein kinase)
LDPEGITVVVRDEGGLPFDYQRYKSGRRELEPGSVKSGLDIVDKIMDSWAVRTEEGKFTEVVFRKKRAGDFDKKSDAQPISASI